MDVRIGVQYSAKEIEVDLGDGVDKAAVEQEIDKVVTAGVGVLWLTDKKGRRVGVAAAKITYIEINADGGDRRMGFVG